MLLMLLFYGVVQIFTLVFTTRAIIQLVKQECCLQTETTLSGKLSSIVEQMTSQSSVFVGVNSSPF